MAYKDPNDPRKIESSRKSALAYFHRNPERQRKVNKQWREKLRRDVIGHYSANSFSCACCGEKEYMFLTIDHINNDGHLERKKYAGSGHAHYRWLIKNGMPEGIQVLCYNCNCGRAKSEGKICPHSLILGNMGITEENQPDVPHT